MVRTGYAVYSKEFEWDEYEIVALFDTNSEAREYADKLTQLDLFTQIQRVKYAVNVNN